MKKFIEEFKTFAMRGNVVDLAIAVVIGAAFGKIVSSLVDNIITPGIGLLLGGVDFSGLSYTAGRDAVFTYGNFIQSVIDFVIVAFVIFVVVKLMNKVIKKEEKKEEETKPKGPTEVELLTEIRDILKR